MKITDGDTIQMSYTTRENTENITVDVEWNADDRFTGRIIDGRYTTKTVDVFLDQNAIRIKNQGHIGTVEEILKVF